MKVRKLVIYCLCLLWAPNLWAETITVGVINLKPWGSVSENREFVGQHIDFFNELSKRTNLTFNYRILSIPRIKEGLKSGDVDMTVIFRREEMSPFVNFVGLVMPYNYYLVGKAGVSFNKENVKKLKKVGYISGEEDVAKKCFSDKFNATAKMLSAPNYGNLLKMVKRGRFDAATIPSKGLKAYLDEINSDESRINHLFILCKNEAYLQVSKKSDILNTDRINLLNENLAAMRKDGTIKSIAAKYVELKH